ncbi:MAG TPA: carboxypeptidase regulatory-like domain-containing protein [Polyangiaceae bacterium]|nr:carboxypeptidase regulatory-like domain-containing protein [Polyangiaceae bacterium]
MEVRRHSSCPPLPRWAAKCLVVLAWTLVLGLCLKSLSHASSGTRLRPLTSFDVAIRTLTAAPDQDEYVVPKNVASAVRIVVKSGDKVLTTEEVAQQLGGAFSVNAELSGPGLNRVVTLPDLGPSDPPPADPLLLPLPALATAGDYKVSNIRFVRSGQAVLDVSPAEVAVKIIDQVLVTSVTTRPLTLDEIQEKGIVLDSDDYLAFEFTIGMATGSESVNFSMPVVFDRQGVPVPTPIAPPADPPRLGVNIAAPQPMLIPAMLKPSAEQIAEIPDLALKMPDGRPIQIPSVLVIPGNVGYLKQFFSAQLFVANGAPSGANLTLHEVTGKVKLPPGADLELGTADDPLALPETIRGPQPETMPIRGLGFDGEPGTSDDTVRFRPGEQGQAEFLIRGEQEGFHSLEFDIEATLEGLPIGPVTITGQARGGVLVRNPFFDMTFTIPSVVRQGETFSVFATVNNIGQGIANDVHVTLDASALAGAVLVGEGSQRIDTLRSGDSKTLEYQFVAQRSGQVLATYLKFDTQAPGGGQLKFTLGVGERGIALSPDTLVLPSGVGELPPGVVSAAMRVLGQAWSIANAPTGTLPANVLRITRAAVTTKALALAEAGLRVRFGQPDDAAVRDLAFDFYGGATLDAGFDQLLRQTQAGHDFARALGTALGSASAALGGALELAKRVDHVAISGPDFVRVALGNGASGIPAEIALVDGGNRRSEAQAAPGALPRSEIPSGTWLPLGGAAGPLLGLVPVASSALYRLELTGTGTGSTDLSVTLPRGGGSFVRGTVNGVTLAAGSRARLTLDLRDPTSLLLESDLEGDGTFEVSRFLATEVLESTGPELLSATVVGPETVDGASPLGFHVAVLFDRIVDASSAAVTSSYTIPKNAVQSASAQLSGRLVFASLAQPEGPYIPTTFRAAGVRDQRGHPGTATTVPMAALLDAPGAVVSGRVIGPDGEPVTSGSVTYENNANWQCTGEPPVVPAGFATTQLDASGRYEFRFVRQDQCGYPWAMLTNDPRTGSLRRVTGFVRAAGEQIVLDIALLGQGSVSGHVRNLQNQVVPGAQVTVVSQTDPQVGASTITDGDGFYQVTGITVGAVSVSAAKGAGVGRSAGNIARAGGSASVDVTIDSGAASVAGHVFTEEGSVINRVPGVSVVFETEGVPIAVATTDDDGFYLFDGVPAGPFEVSAALNARDQDAASGVLAAGEARVGVDLVISIPVPGEVNPTGPGYGSVRGIVRFPDGTPAPDAIVSVGQRGLLSGDDGSFDLFGIPVQPGVTQAVVARSRDGLRSGSATFVLNQDGQIASGVTIALSGLGSAEFTVLSATGTPVVGQTVGLLDRCTSNCGCLPQISDAQGKVRFHDLPIGGVHVHAVRTGLSFVDVASASASVTRDGEVATGTLRFPGSGVVSGVVKNPEGQPVFGAEVVLSSPYFNSDSCGLTSGVSQSMRTDSQGRFRFQAVNLGSVSVTASQAFFPNPTTRSGALTENGQELTFEVPLQEGESTIAGVLQGTVFLPDGVTPAGAGIEVTANGALPDVVVRTDAAGHYRFAKIFPEGSYVLTVSDPITGGVARSGVYLRRAQDQTQDVRLLGRGTVLVRVVDANDAPVSNAFVRLRETGFPNRDFEGAANAANQGVVRFDNVFEGAVSSEVSDNIGRGGRASGTLTGPGATLEMKVRLSITAGVSGVFLAADGVTPVPFGQITLYANGRVLGQTTSGGSGESLGKFHFDHVPAGPVRVEAQDPATARTGFAVGTITAQDRDLDLIIRAQGLGNVEGRVLSNGAPQPGADVTITAGGFQATTSSDALGRYRITGVPEGQVVASANLGAGFLKGSTSGSLSGDGTTLTLDIPLQDSGAVGGIVVHADGSTPAPQASVTLNVNGSSFSTVTGENGRFHFARLPAGSASLAVDLLGSLDRASGSVQVPPGGTAEVTLRLNGVGSVRGVARTANSNPTAGTVVVSGTGAFPYSFTVTAGSNGIFTVPEVLAGPFTVSLTVVTSTFTLYGTASGTVLPGQQANIDVKVQPTGTVRGRALRANGAPALGTQITLALLPNRGSLPLVATDDGSFEAEGVPLGAFELDLRDPFTTGVAKVSGLSLTTNGQIADVGDVMLDDTPIEAIAFEPLDGALDISVTQPIRVTFSDRLRSASGLTVSRDTQQLPATASLSGDGLTVTLTGTWSDSAEITVTATTGVTDIYGRHPQATQSARFHTVDLSAPSVASISPAPGAIEVPTDQVIDIAFSEPLGPGTDLTTLVILSTGGNALLGTSSQTGPAEVRFTPGIALLTNAVFNVSVNGAADHLGNRQTTAFSSTFKTHDTDAPILALVKPAPGSWSADATPLVEVSLADTLSGIETASSTLNVGGVVVSPTRTASFISYTPPLALSDGVHAITATSADRAGNVGSLQAEIQIDTHPPGAASISGVGSGDVLSGVVTLGSSAADSGSGVADIQIFSDNQLVLTLPGPSFIGSLDTTKLPDGPHQLTARARDRAGNQGPAGATVPVIVNNRAIEVSFSAPALGTRVRNGVLVTVSANEPIQSITLSTDASATSDDVTLTASPYTATLDLSVYPEGGVTITATALGFAGESGSGTRLVTIDRTAPSAPVFAKVFAEPPDNGLSLVHGDASAVEGLARVTATNQRTLLSASTLALASGSFGLQLGGVVNDIVTLVAEDSAGNVSAPTEIPISPTTSLPPVAATLRFAGHAVDRVGAGTPALEPDQQRDAVFTLDLTIPAGVTRDLAFVDLEGPLLASTRPEGSRPLGVARTDLGAKLLNGDDGQVQGELAGAGTLVLFAESEGLLSAGVTYRATAGFTNGSRFIGTLLLPSLPLEHVAGGAFSVNNQGVPAGPIGAPDQPWYSNVVSGAFSVANTQTFTHEGPPDPTGAPIKREARSLTFSLNNQQLPFDGNAGPPDPTGAPVKREAGSLAFSVRNERLPFDGNGPPGTPTAPTMWMAMGSTFSVTNQSLLLTQFGLPGQPLASETSGLVVSVRNEATVFVPAARVGTDVMSTLVSVNNETSGPTTIAPSRATVSASVGAGGGPGNGAGGTEGASSTTDPMAMGVALASLSIEDVVAAESDAEAQLEVTLSSPADATVTVDYVVERGAATPGSEFDLASGRLTFTPGTLSQTLRLPVYDDTLAEMDETFTVTLSSASGATLANAEARVTIVDDDELGPRSWFFEDFEGEALDEWRWNSLLDEAPVLQQGTAQLSDVALESREVFALELPGVAARARLSLPMGGERFGWNAFGGVADASYYFETVPGEAAVHAVALALNAQGAAYTLLDVPIPLDSTRFVDLAIERHPDGVIFLVNDVEVAMAGHATLTALPIGVGGPDGTAALRVDWIDAGPVPPIATPCLEPPAGLRTWWPGDGSTRDVQSGVDGVLGPRASYARGLIGQAFDLRGGDEAGLWLPEVFVSPTDQLTLSGWLKLRSAPEPGLEPVIFATTTAGGDAYVARLDADGRPSFWVRHHGLTARLLGSATLDDGEWHHVATTLSASAVTLFVDGHEAAAGVLGSEELDVPAASGAGLGLDGWLDETAFFDRALSAAETQQMFDWGSAGYCLPRESGAKP